MELQTGPCQSQVSVGWGEGGGRGVRCAGILCVRGASSTRPRVFVLVYVTYTIIALDTEL